MRIDKNVPSITLQGKEITDALDMYDASDFVAKGLKGARIYHPDESIEKNNEERTLAGSRLVGLASVTSRVVSGELGVSEDAKTLANVLGSVLKDMGIEPPVRPTGS